MIVLFSKVCINGVMYTTCSNRAYISILLGFVRGDVFCLLVYEFVLFSILEILIENICNIYFEKSKNLNIF